MDKNAAAGNVSSIEAAEGEELVSRLEIEKEAHVSPVAGPSETTVNLSLSPPVPDADDAESGGNATQEKETTMLTGSGFWKKEARQRAFARFKSALSPKEWVVVACLTAAVVGLHVVGWGLLVLAVIPGRYRLSARQIFGVGLGVTSYTLGLRHAFDADHIAAIDNTTRKFMADGRRPFSVGFWFSLGHSSVVFLAAVLITAGFKTFAGEVADENSRLHNITSLVGVSVSGTFLYVIGIINLIIFFQILKVFREMRTGQFGEKELEDHLNKRGFLNRFLGWIANRVREPWHMYPLGFLFGLGFDTATEVTLLFLAAGAASSGLPWFAVLTLPILFAAGMTLLDTIDGALMTLAYGWAFEQPVRRVYYNLIVTGLSAAVALLIGTVEILQIVLERSGAKGKAIDWLHKLNLNTIGFIIVGLFVVTWVVAVAVWHFGRIPERWALPPTLLEAKEPLTKEA